jgi:hypothetical protein
MPDKPPAARPRQRATRRSLSVRRLVPRLPWGQQVGIQDPVRPGSGAGFEVEIDVQDLAPTPALHAPELREAIAAALKTTDAEVLADVEGDFRGAYGSAMEYIRQQMLELLPPWSAWLLECCDNDRLRHGYEAGKLLVWTLPHPHDPHKLLIFESPRAKFRASRR